MWEALHQRGDAHDAAHVVGLDAGEALPALDGLPDTKIKDGENRDHGKDQAKPKNRVGHNVGWRRTKRGADVETREGKRTMRNIVCERLLFAFMLVDPVWRCTATRSTARLKGAHGGKSERKKKKV